MALKSTNKTYLASLILLLVSIATGASAWAQTAPKSTDSITRSTSMNLPTSPQEIWDRILILMKKNQGFVSKQEVEEVLGMHFTHTEKDGELRYLGSQFLHTHKQDVPGLGELNVGLFDDPKKSGLRMGWGPEHADRPDCPSLDKVIEDLAQLGWESGWNKPSPGTTAVIFWRSSDVAESRRPGGKPLNSPVGISQLFVEVPYESSQCVVGFGTTIYP